MSKNDELIESDFRDYPLTIQLGIPLREGVQFGVSAQDIEELLRKSVRDRADIGYPPGGPIYVIEVKPPITPLTKQEVIDLFDDFGNKVSQYSKQDIERLRERFKVAGVEK